MIEEKKGLKKQHKFYEEDGDQCWCIFDIDEYWNQNKKVFVKAVTLAKQNNISLAWSNECFELWYLLHFQTLQTAISRKDYDTRLKKHFQKLDGKSYSKNNKVFMRLVQKQSEAVKNAKRIIDQYKVEKNPSTAVFLLVEELNGLEK